MKLIERNLIEEKLKNKGLNINSNSWLYIQFDKIFEEEYTKDKLELDGILNILEKFLENKDIRNIIFIPDSAGWASNEYGDKSIKFNDINEMKKFLEEEILFGAENYYVTDEDINYIITICHEEDLHVNGSKEFVEIFRQELH